MKPTNESVELAVVNLKAAQDVISKMFKVSADATNIFDITDECWEYNPRSGTLTYGIEESDCEFSRDGATELSVQFVTNAVGDYALVYATEDTYNAKVNRRWNNLAYYIVNRNKEIK